MDNFKLTCIKSLRFDVLLVNVLKNGKLQINLSEEPKNRLDFYFLAVFSAEIQCILYMKCFLKYVQYVHAVHCTVDTIQFW